MVSTLNTAARVNRLEQDRHGISRAWIEALRFRSAVIFLLRGNYMSRVLASYKLTYSPGETDYGSSTFTV